MDEAGLNRKLKQLRAAAEREYSNHERNRIIYGHGFTDGWSARDEIAKGRAFVRRAEERGATAMNTFQQFSAINKSRAMRWHRGGLDEWSPTDWATAFAGEAGELCNAIKKFRRVEDEIQGHDGDTPQPKSYDDAVKAIAKEIGDVYAYLDLLAQRFGLDTWTCVRETFNKISEREGMPEVMPEMVTQWGAVHEAAQRIATDRDFVVHSNDTTERAIRFIVEATR